MKVITAFSIAIICLFLTINTSAQEQKVILNENFDNNSNGWAIADYPEGKFEMKSGYYYFDHKMSGGSWVNGVPVNMPMDTDWEIETSIKTIKSIPLWTFGLVWGRDNKGNGYEFTINKEGDYSLEKQENYTPSNLSFQKWMKSDNVKKGNGVVNILKIVKKGEEMTFYINGKKEVSLPYQKFFGNIIGFKINRSQKIAVDYLTVRIADTGEEDKE